MQDGATSIAEKAMATHSSVLAWRIPGTAEPGGLPSMGSHRWKENFAMLAKLCVHLPLIPIISLLGN